MAYQEPGSGPPHFDDKNYQMWSKRMGAFLRGKCQILWDVTVDTSSSSSSSEDEGDRRKNKKSSKNLSGLSCFARDDFCTMALSSGSKKSTQSDSDSDSDDEVHDELPFLH
jgi:hypothetical protein